MKTALVVAAMFALVGCSDAPTAERALRSSGLKDIKTTGYVFFSCGKDDMFATGFIATNANGQRVTGAVCNSWLKGATIRYD